jgi:hypothetical protein
MSILRPLTFHCSACLHPISTGVYDSINAARRPDLREAILADTLHALDCGGCGKPMRVPPSLVYLDIPGELVVVAFPAEDRAEWAAAVADGQRTLDAAFGHGPGAEILAQSTVRVVFGWAALREKIVIQDAGLDDVDVEITKMAILRTSASLPVFDELDLRLIATKEGAMRMAWVDVETSERIERLTVPADAVSSVQPRSEGWSSLREELSSTPYVDLSRFVLA